jgi:hypothetical protein
VAKEKPNKRVVQEKNLIEPYNRNISKDNWDKLNIIGSIMGALLVPIIAIIISIILWTKSNAIQDFLKNREDNSKRFELFVSLYPKLISNDSIERVAASKVITKLGEKETDLKIITMEILKLKDPSLAVKTSEAIKNNPLSDLKSKQKAKDIIKEITESIQFIELPEIPINLSLTPKFDPKLNSWLIVFDKISNDDLIDIERKFSKLEKYQFLLTYNKTERCLELNMRQPFVCLNIKVIKINNHQTLKLFITTNIN